MPKGQMKLRPVYQVRFTVPEAMKDRLEALARQQRRPIPELAREIVAWYLSQLDSQQPAESAGN